jgi:CubicO group peptidase (beta-lactamase class C family)
MSRTATLTRWLALAIALVAGAARAAGPLPAGLPGPQPVPGQPAVTLRQLLTHTSGLPRDTPFPYCLLDDEWPRRLQRRE